MASEKSLWEAMCNGSLQKTWASSKEKAEINLRFRMLKKYGRFNIAYLRKVESSNNKIN